MVRTDARVFTMLRGVGQGLAHAGDLTDWLWNLIVEREYACSFNRRLKYGVRSYDRFRDDTLVRSENCPEKLAQ